MRRFLLLLLATVATTVRADTEYGAQGLANMVEDSTLVITSSSARRLPDPHVEFAAYSVRVASAIVGATSASTLTVLSPRGEELRAPSSDAFTGAIVFLDGPLTDEERANWNMKEDPVYMLTSAQFSVIKNTQARRQAIRDYHALITNTNAAAQTGQLDWANKALLSADTLLQESAVLLAAQLLVDQPVAADLLGRATTDQRLNVSLREESIELLGTAGTTEAFATLQRVAISPELPASLRRLAERTFIDQYHQAHRR